MLRHKGFSFFELNVGLVICAIIVVIFMTFGTNHLQKNQIESVVSEIQNLVNFTRLETITQDSNLLLSPLNNNWSRGAELFKITNNKMQKINMWDWGSYRIDVSWHGFQSNTNLLFTPNLHASAVNGFFLIKNKHKEYKLVLNRLGRVKEILINDE